MRKEILDIIMLSDFNRNGGGRETWLYNFLPELLEDEDIQKVNLFGYTNQEGNNISSASFLSEKKEVEKRLFPIVFKGKSSKFPMAFSMFNQLKKYKEVEKPSVTLAMGIFELFMMLFIKRFKNTKKIVWLRSIFIHEKAYAVPKIFRKGFLYLEVWLLKKADIVISNGDDIQGFYKKYKLQVHVIKNGINSKKWKLPLPDLKKTIHVAYIGRLSQVKGIESYLELARKVKKGENHSNFIFHIVGNEGVYEEEVNTLVKEKIVVNHGVISNQKLPKFLKNIDVCVALTFASDKGGGGGTSNAMLEQMAASRVMLAWKNVIFNQYLNDENAYLVDQYDITGLEDALLIIKNNIKLAKEKSIKAQKTIIPYTYSMNVNEFKKIVFNSKSY